MPSRTTYSGRSSKSSLLPSLTPDGSVYGLNSNLELHLPKLSQQHVRGHHISYPSYASFLRASMSGITTAPESERWDRVTQIKYEPDGVSCKDVWYIPLENRMIGSGVLMLSCDDPSMRAFKEQAAGFNIVAAERTGNITAQIGLISDNPTCDHQGSSLQDYQGEIVFGGCVDDERKDASLPDMGVPSLPSPDANGDTMVKVLRDWRKDSDEEDLAAAKDDSENGEIVWVTNLYDLGEMPATLSVEVDEPAGQSVAASGGHGLHGKSRSHLKRHQVQPRLGVRFSCRAPSNPFQ